MNETSPICIFVLFLEKKKKRLEAYKKKKKIIYVNTCFLEEQ